MFSDKPLTDRIELRRAQSADRLAFRPDLENVGGAFRFWTAPHRGTDNPDRRGATGVFRVHQTGAVLKITGFGSTYEDERRRYGAAAFALHVFTLEGAPVNSTRQFLHQGSKKSVTLCVQRVLRTACHQAVNAGAPAILLNSYASQLAQGRMTVYVLAETVVVNILLARYLRGKQRWRQPPCTVCCAVKGEGPVEPLQHFQFRTFTSALAHEPSPLALSSPFNVNHRILSVYTIDRVEATVVGLTPTFLLRGDKGRAEKPGGHRRGTGNTESRSGPPVEPTGAPCHDRASRLTAPERDGHDRGEPNPGARIGNEGMLAR